MKKDKPNEEKYPSVTFAYDLAIKSYDWVYRRSEVMDDKIEKLIAWATGLNLALVAYLGNLIKNNVTINFCSAWFYSAITLFTIGTAFGMIAKLHGSLKTIVPSMFIKNWLHKSEWEFKKDALYRASEDNEYNRQYVNNKGKIATFAAFAFFFEAISLIIWFIRQY
jgi:hypothetical protein